jgi:large subunit ribosomal protein L15
LDVYKAGPKPKGRKRVGRGQGSGQGKTAGRGMRGWGQRTGCSIPLTYEGGQMPLFRRLPKRGFNNAQFKKRFQLVSVGDLGRFNAGAKVGPAELAASGLVGKADLPVKVLCMGKIEKALEVSAHAFSAGASAAIEKAGGKAVVIGSSGGRAGEK